MSETIQNNPLTPDEVNTVRDIARSIWMVNFRAENPNATPEESKEDWQKNKASFNKLGNQVLRIMLKKGYSVTLAA